MAFCRRCGDIVTTDKCRKCGGAAVAPSVKFDNSKKEGSRDTWSKTYVTQSSSKPEVKEHPKPIEVETKATPVAEAPALAPSSRPRTPSRFPRPQSYHFGSSTTVQQKQQSTLNRVSAHITAATNNRPTSPLKNQMIADRETRSDVTVIKSHITGSLVKVYGSVLSRPESLTTFECDGCSTIFQPDMTIYPSPSKPEKYLCKDCFEADGEASRGVCESCHKPVFALTKVEGGAPVENAGRIWHASCFKCNGCSKDISSSPMVDILGRPCCEDCFDECLKQGTPSPTVSRKRAMSRDSDSRIGGMKRGGRESSPSREGSPVVEELSKRLGIVTKESPSPSPSQVNTRVPGELSPTIERLTRKLNGLITGPGNAPEPSSNADFPSNPRSSVSFLIPKSATSSTSSSSSASFSDSDASSFSHSTTSSALSSPASSPPSSKERDDKPKVETSSTTPVRKGGAESRPSLIPVRGSFGSKTTSSPGTNASPVTPQGKPHPHRTTPNWTSPSTFLDSPTVHRAAAKIGPNPSGTGSLPTQDALAKLPKGRSFAPTDSRPSATHHTSPRTPTNRNAQNMKIFPKENAPSRSQDSTPTNPRNTKSTPIQSPRTPQNGPKNSPLHAFTTPEALINATCDACARPLLAQDMRGRIVTVPLSPIDDADTESNGANEIQVERYHHACFRCANCGDAFGELDGKANFIREGGKAVHVSCASPLRVVKTSHPVPSVYPPKDGTGPPVFDRSSTVPASAHLPNTKTRERARTISSPRAATPPAPVSPTSSGRFRCPGCQNTVFQMEKGVVPGPQGSKWHASCLVCGGKDWKARRTEAKRWNSGPSSDMGCGKKLDSQARTDRHGRVWCRDCMVLLSPSSKAPPSPSRVAPLQPMETGNGATYGRLNLAFPQIHNDASSGRIVSSLVSHFTGNGEPLSASSSSTTFGDMRSPSPIKTHFTGRSVSPVRRQYTGSSALLGGGTRSPSPVKSHFTGAFPIAPQLTGSGLPVTHSARSRPNSVVGHVRSTSPLKPQQTGGAVPLMPQMTGSGLPVTRPRPKSVMGTRATRGIELVRQMTGPDDT